MTDTISRADAIEAKPEYRNEDMLDKEKSTYNKGWNDCNDAWVAIIKALPSAEQTDCTDFVNWLLEKVMDEEMWELNAVAYGEIICRKLEKLGVLEVTEEPSYYIRHIENNTKPSNLVYRPSADAVQGEWVDIDDYYRMATCSHCHKVTMFEKWGEYTKPYDFCPNCGAMMTPYKGGDPE